MVGTGGGGVSANPSCRTQGSGELLGVRREGLEHRAAGSPPRPSEPRLCGALPLKRLAPAPRPTLAAPSLPAERGKTSHGRPRAAAETRQQHRRSPGLAGDPTDTGEPPRSVAGGPEPLRQRPPERRATGRDTPQPSGRPRVLARRDCSLGVESPLSPPGTPAGLPGDPDVHTSVPTGQLARAIYVNLSTKHINQGNKDVRQAL